MESIGIASLYPLVDIFQDANQLDYYKDKFAFWVPAVDSLSRKQFLSYSFFAMGTFFVFKNLFLVLAGYGNIKVSTNLYCSWMNQILKTFMNKPYSYFMENKAGDLAQRKIMQTHKASGALRGFILLLGGLTNIAGIFLVLCFINLKAALAATFMMVPVYFITMTTSRGKVYNAGNHMVKLEQKAFGLITEILSGIKQLKVFRAEDHFQNCIQKIWDEFSRHSILNQFVATLPRPALETLAVLAGAGILALFATDADGQTKNVFPIIAVFAAGIYRILPLAAGVSAQMMSFASVLPSVEIVADLLSEETKENPGQTLPPMTKKIEMQNVSFSYSTREAVLNNLSLTFENNKFYGIVGVSGSGKSTIIDLISGFFKPQKGKVLIDGIDLSEADIRTWLCQIGLISQDTFIFSGTIEDNICFGVNAENRDQNRVKEAARIAYANEFIDSLPEGYHTTVGERGVKLSGGQRQRLAIARAIYLNPPVLIFDEATSSLDANSEKKVQGAIDALHGKRTVVVVAHRLVTVANADYIYVIENGSLAEKGTHEELRARNGIYSRLCAKQSLK